MPGGWWKKKSNRFRPSSTLGKAFRSQPMLLETHVISHRKNTTASICRFVGRNEITDTIARDYRMSLGTDGKRPKFRIQRIEQALPSPQVPPVN
jgi:hypothetical protein